MQHQHLTTAGREAIPNAGPFLCVTLDPYKKEVMMAFGDKAWVGTYREALETETIAAHLMPETIALLRMNVDGTAPDKGGLKQ
ncbi:hypothetical protein [Marinobacter fonticola]|uniref:hypothetical protein n=1 Tax=Marinobacter fonticola TaxID=2603215 RepID=UPI0011E7FFEF|nr:hypothetical protein [Marinobacter fonticola]